MCNGVVIILINSNMAAIFKPLVFNFPTVDFWDFWYDILWEIPLLMLPKSSVHDLFFRVRKLLSVPTPGLYGA